MRFHRNTSLEGDQRHNIEQPNRNSSAYNFHEELRDHSAASGSNPTMSRSSTNDVRPRDFDPAFRRFETPREHVYGYEEASYARTGQAPDHVFRRQRPTKERKPAAFDGTTSWRDYIVHFDMMAELNCWNDETKLLELATSLRGIALSVLSDTAARISV